MNFDDDDVAATRLAIVQLAEHRIGTQEQIARGFNLHPNAITGYIKAYRKGGVPALVPKVRGPKGPRIGGSRIETVILAAKRSGQSNREISAKLGFGRTTISNVLKRLGWRDEDKQLPIPSNTEIGPIEARVAPAKEGSEPSTGEIDTEQPVSEKIDTEQPVSEKIDTEQPVSEKIDTEQPVSEKIDTEEPTEIPIQFTADSDPSNRSIDRILASQGLLFDAAPLFENADNVRDVGALLAIPVLVQQGVFFEALKVFAGIGPAFYGVRNSVVFLCLMMMLNLSRLQDVMRREPTELGRIIGLDRCPELKTLRRKLAALSLQNKSLAFMDGLARRQLRREQGRLWTYVDGHVEVYTGMHQLRSHHVTQLRAARPSVLDYWVNQPNGLPLLVVTGTEEEGMVKQIPKRIKQLNELAPGRQLTVIFDREGWSPKLFAQIKSTASVHFLTYRKKGTKSGLPQLDADQFHSHQWQTDWERKDYDLADTQVTISYLDDEKRLQTVQLRQITRRKPDGKQTHILTDDEASPAAELAHRMFGRWGQENYLKYAREHRDLDALVSHGTEAVDGSRLVDNPKRKPLQQKLKELEDQLAQLYLEHGKTLAEGLKPDLEAFRSRVDAAQKAIACQLAERNALSAKVPLSDTDKGKVTVQPRIECRRLMHVFRIVAHRADSALLELLRPHFKDWRHEGRELVRDILHSSGNLRVTDSTLTVEIKPQASPYKTRALAALCKELTGLQSTFPGTNLKMAFTIAQARSSPQ